MAAPTKTKPRRGEVWLANLEPTKGAEMNKTRPVLVVSGDTIGVLPIKLVAPITAWSAGKGQHVWLVRVGATARNGLSKESCVDVLQVRGLDVERLLKRLGVLSSDDLDEVVTALALVVGYEDGRR